MLISLGVIVLISITFLLYKTFASFSEEVEFPIVNGKVDYFGKSDVYFFFYKGDELLNEMPQKGNVENLVFDYGECDNDASVVWDNEIWGPMVKNLNKRKTKCTIYFKELTLPQSLQPNDITMTKDIDEWTNKDVEVTLTNNNYKEFTLQYRTNRDTTWQDYETPFKVGQNNTIVYVKLKSNSGDTSDEFQIGSVTNIDKLPPTNVSFKPSYTLPAYGDQTNIYSFSKITGTDESNETNGASGELKFYFTTDKGKTWYPENGYSQDEIDHYPVEQNRRGNFYGMKAVDKAGNETITKYYRFIPYSPDFSFIQYYHIDNLSSRFSLSSTVEYSSEPLSNFRINLIKIAEVDENNNYMLASNLENLKLTYYYEDFNSGWELDEKKEMNVQEYLDKFNINNVTYETYWDAYNFSQVMYEALMRDSYAPPYIISSDANGNIDIKDLSSGLYLVYSDYYTKSGYNYQINPMLISTYTGTDKGYSYYVSYDVVKMLY